MSCFLTGVLEELQVKYHSSMLHDNMYISHLMVHKKRIEEARDKRRIKDAKR